jgi:ketosteroid isomerase-like protein
MGTPNIETIQSVYDAFGRGDVPAILAMVTDDVDWASGPDSSAAPWYGIHKGKGEVEKFFDELGASVEVTKFEPLTFGSNENEVFVVIRFGFKSRATGKSGEMDIHHRWRLENGKIALYRGSDDTALVAEVLSA